MTTTSATPALGRRGEHAAAWIASLQSATGMIPWYEGGHADPWNHVEAAMALSAAGDLTAAARAYAWVRAVQQGDGGFCAYYRVDGTPEQARRDTNATAYVACGVLHHVVASGDVSFGRTMYETVEAAVDFALCHERATGGFAWSVEPDGTPAPFALLAASSSIHLSLGCAAELAALVGADPARYLSARARLRESIVARPWAFADKSAFAMDWYYPVLCGVLAETDARARLAGGWASFVEDGNGVRCRSDGRWVTAAETAECAIACARLGDLTRARALLTGIDDLCAPGGAVLTGLVHPERVSFPEGEVTTYSAAAVVLAEAVLGGEHATTRLFCS